MAASASEACNVASALVTQAAQRGDAAAIHYPTSIRRGLIKYRSCSYRELDELSDAYARGLHEYGIVRGTRTALMVPPGLDFFALFFALFKAGVVPVLIDPGIGLKPLKKCLAEAQPEAFIGVSRAHAARALLRWAPDSIDKLVTSGPRLGWGGLHTRQLAALGQRSSGAMLEATRPGEMAAILFTSGSTGIPKGVVYRHRHFVAQVDLLRTAFGIEAGEVDLPTFPPFALFDPALGMTTIVPWMDPTRPSKANPELLLQSIERFGVTNVFGSPALLRVLGGHAKARGLVLNTVRRVISAGAAVPIDAAGDMQAALPATSKVYSGYGATECLPVACIDAGNMDADINALTQAGEGICVGRPVAPTRVVIMPVRDRSEPLLPESELLPAGVAGEIVVHGPTTTDAYWQREAQTRRAKCTDRSGRVWHRMGDAGYLDEQGRLWYCGRTSQGVECDGQLLFPDQVEAHFNTHPEVARTALVNAGGQPVLCAETRGRATRMRTERIRTDLLQMAGIHPRFKGIRNVLFHSGFPVDIRHNSKIGREQLALWAEGKLS